MYFKGVPFTIGAPTEIVVSPLDVDDVECFGEDDGKIQITLSGGTLPYNGFSWVGPNAIPIQHKIYTHYMQEIIPLQQQMVTLYKVRKFLS